MAWANEGWGTTTVPVAGGTAPAITNVRTVSSVNTLFNVSSGGSTASNNLNANGTSVYSGATVNITLDGTLLGNTATTAADGSWSFPLGIVSDASHTIAARVTAAGSTSPDSSNFTFTVAPGLTGMPVAVGANMPMTSPVTVFAWNGWNFYCENQASVADACIFANTHELDFTVHPADATAYDGSNRSEINGQFSGNIQESHTLSFTFEFLLSASSPVNDCYAAGPWGGNSWFILGQLQAEPGSLGAGNPPYAHALGNPNGGDCFNINSQTYGNVNATVYNLGTSNLARGAWHTVDVILKPATAPNGIVNTRLNGVQVLSLNTLGGPGRAPYFFKMGIYRGKGSTTQTQIVRYRNLLINYI